MLKTIFIVLNGELLGKSQRKFYCKNKKRFNCFLSKVGVLDMSDEISNFATVSFTAILQAA